MTEVKVYRITGTMLLSHDRYPEERVFRLEVPASSLRDALERVYSELGSRHKVKRRHIKIKEVVELRPEEAVSAYVRKLLSME